MKTRNGWGVGTKVRHTLLGKQRTGRIVGFPKTEVERGQGLVRVRWSGSKSVFCVSVEFLTKV